MKILLINPPRFKGSSVVREVRCAGLTLGSIYPPMRLAYMAAYLRKKGFKVNILDCNANNYNFSTTEKIIRKENPNVVIFTSSPTTMTHDSNIANICKKINPDIITILDDSHIAPVMPKKLLNHFKNIDILIRGESEFTVLDLVRNLKNLKKVKGISYRNKNKVINNPIRKPGDINKIPSPAYDLLPIYKYTSVSCARKKPFITIFTSVGCPFKCSFCIIGGATVWRGYSNKWRTRNPQIVLDEVEFLYKKFKIKSFYFFDETFTIKKDNVMKICQGIIDRKINIEWACNSRIDTIDSDRLKIMKKAGCWKICYGVETASKQLLDNVKKDYSFEKVKEIIKLTKETGIFPSASFMIGLPGETKETIKQTLKFAKEIDPYRAQFVITVPYPGTALYDYAKKHNLIEKDYSFSGFDAYGIDNDSVMKTGALSPEEVVEEQKKIFMHFYFSPIFILKTLTRVRSFTELTNLIKTIKYLI